jgi:hypothetical protein
VEVPHGMVGSSGGRMVGMEGVDTNFVPRIVWGQNGDKYIRACLATSP